MSPESPDARLANVDDDGWTLLNAEQRLQSGDGLYWIPSRWVREHLEEHVPEGGFVKLLFRIRDPKDLSHVVTERMWVSCDSRHGDFYHGHLANEPKTAGAAVEGMPVWYLPEHVIDYSDANGESRASEGANVVRCDRHGPSQECFVCEHLGKRSGTGFHAAEDAENPRPDAWCDDCNALIQSVSSWDDLGDRHPKLMIICGGCYDSLKAKQLLSNSD